MADGLDAGLREKHALLSPYLNERQRRLIAAADAKMLGRGGIATLSRIAGLSRTTLDIRKAAGGQCLHGVDFGSRLLSGDFNGCNGSEGGPLPSPEPRQAATLRNSRRYNCASYRPFDYFDWLPDGGALPPPGVGGDILISRIFGRAGGSNIGRHPGSSRLIKA